MLEFREFKDLDDADLASAWNALEEGGASPSVFTSLAGVRRIL
jgi:hypothetical protein